MAAAAAFTRPGALPAVRAPPQSVEYNPKATESFVANVVSLSSLRLTDIDRVGGKNASLGEMIARLASAGVRVPGGFATTAACFREFLEQSRIGQEVARSLGKLDGHDTDRLAAVSEDLRRRILEAELAPGVATEVRDAYARICDEASEEVPMAVRSSATAEDLPDASFAGQQDTYLNVRGAERILESIKRVFSSLYTARAISYRIDKGFDHSAVALSVGVQRMVRSDLASSGVMFTLDTESGFEGVIFVTSSYGLGEMVVQGSVNPDEFYIDKRALDAGRASIVRRSLGSKTRKMVFVDGGGGDGVRVVDVPASERQSFSVSDEDLAELGRQARAIEGHYGRHMDIEWSKDGIDGKIYILQARPETVKSREDSGRSVQRHTLVGTAEPIVEGRAIGQKIGVGTARVLGGPEEMGSLRRGETLVADMTDPDWEPVMKRAAAIVTNRGGRTCHAAIIARELGVPAIVGCGDATGRVPDGERVTVSCAEGDTGRVYLGEVEHRVTRVDLGEMPEIPVKMMMNVANPDMAFEFSRLPNDGVGLARLEFIIGSMVGMHPQAVLGYRGQPPALQQEMRQACAGYADPREFYVEKAAEGIATIALAFHPKPVILRLSDFKSNEYSGMLGGRQHEPHEENPMLGYRGAARYLSGQFRECFELEVEAIRRVREGIGLDNIEVMVPFVRTVAEAKAVVGLLAELGLERGRAGLRLIMMCEVPSNAILADEFLEHFDGFSIGSNDLTQLTLALDRDSGLVAGQFDERDQAVRHLVKRAIESCVRAGKYVGICGQGPSDHPDFAAWLVGQGISSLSLNPDSIIDTWMSVAKAPARR